MQNQTIISCQIELPLNRPSMQFLQAVLTQYGIWHIISNDIDFLIIHEKVNMQKLRKSSKHVICEQ
jgi:hypothetical protein